MNPFSASIIMTDLLNEVQEAGITLKVRSDIDQLYEIESHLTGKKLSPLFRPDRFDLVPDRVFWIEGTNAEGEIVHVQASKLEDTGRSNLGDMLTAQLSRCFKEDLVIAPCEPLSKLGGLCAYHGDTWISKDLRKNGYGPLLTKIGLLATYIRWQPDYIYAWFENPIMYGGFGVKSWYHNFARVGTHWRGWILPNEFFSWMSHMDMVNLIELENPQNELKHRPR